MGLIQAQSPLMVRNAVAAEAAARDAAIAAAVVNEAAARNTAITTAVNAAVAAEAARADLANTRLTRRIADVGVMDWREARDVISASSIADGRQYGWLCEAKAAGTFSTLRMWCSTAGTAVTDFKLVAWKYSDLSVLGYTADIHSSLAAGLIPNLSTTGNLLTANGGSIASGGITLAKGDLIILGFAIKVTTTAPTMRGVNALSDFMDAPWKGQPSVTRMGWQVATFAGGTPAAMTSPSRPAFMAYLDLSI